MCNCYGASCSIYRTNVSTNTRDYSIRLSLESCSESMLYLNGLMLTGDGHNTSLHLSRLEMSSTVQRPRDFKLSSLTKQARTAFS